MKPHGPWTIKNRELKYENPWIKVYEDKVIRPDKKEGIHIFIDLKKGVAVLPMDEKGNIYLTREFHYGVGEYTLEVVSGGIDMNETPLEAARRELQEELGISAQKWIELGPVDRFTTYMNCRAWLFLAQGLSFNEKHPEGSETASTVKMKFKDAVKKVMEGEIVNSMSQILILKAVQHSRQEHR
ncbi:MAG TPA: NUDIX hydrolase [Candidatus Nanoarchaeia archaeon]|nr:NUDIX hydrolase [Candidatus Nanoarchaeia archaeon]